MVTFHGGSFPKGCMRQEMDRSGISLGKSKAIKKAYHNGMPLL